MSADFLDMSVDGKFDRLKARMVYRRFISLGFILVTLFLIVFVQTHQRNAGYQFAKKSKELRDLKEQAQILNIQLARQLGPSKIQSLATGRLALKKVKESQVIYLSGDVGEGAQ